MKKAICIILIVTVISVCTLPCSAALLDSVRIDYDNLCIELSGSGCAGNESVAIEVADDNLVIKDNNGTVTVPVGAVDCIMSGSANENGRIDMRFSLRDGSGTGKKLIRISSEYGLFETGEFVYYEDSKVLSVLADFKAAVSEKDINKLKAILLDADAAAILINDSMIYDVYNTLRDKFLSSSEISEILKAAEPSKISEAQKTVKSVLIPYIAANCKSATEIGYILDSYADILGITDTIYSDIYVKMNDTGRLRVVSEVVAESYASTAEFVKAFYEKVLLNAVKYAEDHTKISPLINGYLGRYFGFSTSAYNSVSNRYYVDSGLINGVYKNYAEFKALFDRLISEAAGSAPVTPPGGGGGGVSGGNTIGTVTGGSGNLTDIGRVDEKYFYDLDDCTWAKDTILKLFYKGVVNGTSDGRYEPMRTVTREEFVKLLSEAFGFTVDDAQSTFSDVPKDRWSYKYISSAVLKGITKGTSETTFEPLRTITREEMAVMCLNAITAYKDKEIEIDANSADISFADNDKIAPYAFYAVTVLNSKGIILGRDNNCFAPKATSTRAEAAVIVARAIEFLGIY